MINSQQKSHGEWMIYTFCRENPSADWQPGQPRRYAVRGFAECNGHSTATGWASASRINWNDGLEGHASSDSESQAEIVSALRKFIDGRVGLPT